MKRKNIHSGSICIPLHHKLALKLLTVLVKIVGKTTRITWKDSLDLDQLEAKYPQKIIAAWHNNTLYSMFVFRHRNYDGIVSKSKDGNYIAWAGRQFGLGCVRGSSSHGGREVLIQAVKHLKKTSSSLSVTPDGRRGPKYKVQPGIIMIAKLTGLPIIPWHFQAVSRWEFPRSWDFHKFPKPFSVVYSSLGTPLHVPADINDTEIGAYADRLEKLMMDNVQWTETQAKK